MKKTLKIKVLDTKIEIKPEELKEVLQRNKKEEEKYKDYFRSDLKDWRKGRIKDTEIGISFWLKVKQSKDLETFLSLLQEKEIKVIKNFIYETIKDYSDDEKEVLLMTLELDLRRYESAKKEVEDTFNLMRELTNTVIKKPIVPEDW